jgi:transcriptional regulator with GAF, ATPase, and Fis domain
MSRSVADQARQAGRRYEALLRLSEALSACPDPEDLTEVFSVQLREFLAFVRFYVVVYKENSADVEWAVVGREKSLLDVYYTDVPVEQRPSWQAYSTQEPFHIHDWSTDDRVPARFKQGIAAQGLEFGPLVCVPLTTPHRRLGALGMAGPPGTAYSNDDVSFLRVIGRVVAFAIDDNFNLKQIRVLKDQLYRENLALRDEVDRVSMFEEIVGTSKALEAVLSRVAKVAPTDSTVFITGETGTGKELIARAVHKRSQRSGRAFVSVNCAALAPTLISSELFGHEKGAFTGATQRRLGRFELADGGTIFLDEVGELPSDTQVALLRVLQEREFERVGGAQSIHVDVRVIAATNRALIAAVANGTFRHDLFYRLNVFPIEVPPLRERKDDILTLIEYFVQRYANRAGKNIRSIDKKTLDRLQSYEWPGNIRELQNVIERSVILSSEDIFSVDELWLSKESSKRSPRPQAPRSFDDESREEREVIEAALTECRGRVGGPTGAAAKLGIPPSTLDYKIKTLKISKNKFKFR